MAAEQRLVVEHLIDFANDTLAARRYDGCEPKALVERFVGDAVIYLTTMGASASRERVHAVLGARADLRRHPLFVTATLPSSVANVSSSTFVDVELGSDDKATPLLNGHRPSSDEDVAVATERHISEVVQRVRESIRTRLLDSSYLDESIEDQHFFAVSVHVRYNAGIHQTLIRDLTRLYSAANARAKPLRPQFVAPFMLNRAHVTDEYQDVAVRLFFVFHGDPRPHLSARAKAPSSPPRHR